MHLRNAFPGPFRENRPRETSMDDRQDDTPRLEQALTRIRELETENADLRESSQRYMALVTEAPLPILVHADYRIVFINPAAVRAFGGDSPDQFLGREILDIVPEERRELARRRIERLYAKRGHFPLISVRYHRLDKTPFDVEIMATMADWQGRPAGQVIFRDVTEERRAQADLRHSEERFRAFFDNVEDMIYYQGMDGTLSMLNRASSLITGYPTAEFDKDPQLWRRIIHPDDVRDAEQFFRDYPKGVPYYEVTYRLRTRDGQTKWIESRMYGARNEAGAFIGYHCIDRDVTERTALERSLVEARDRAEEASRAKNAFLATMSHEIRTPLNGIMGMLQLAETTDLSGEQADYVAGALTSCRNLLRVLSDILDISRIEAGAMGLVDEEFPLAAVLDPVMDLVAVEARRKGLDLSLEVAPDVPARLRGDSGRLRQVIFNLVGNAVKYTETGSVRVTVSRLPFCPVPDGVCLYMGIADTGIGIPDDKIEHVFEPFTQLEATFHRSHGGTGLGLSIVRRLLLLMNAACAVESLEGRGTTFHLSLPLRRGGPEAGTAPGACRDTARQARVLVAEDDPVNLFTIMRFLEKLGHAPRGAADGREALEMLRAEPFDCVLMDIQMPGRNGLETARDIRCSTTGAFDPDIPIVALTAHAMSGDKEAFLAAGMNAYLAKPVELEALREVLDAVLCRDGERRPPPESDSRDGLPPGA
jgi:PAS domain S-box-containing protein